MWHLFGRSGSSRLEDSIPPKCGQFGLPMFWRSVGEGDVNAALSEGFKLDCVGVDGNRPIHFAAMYGNEICVKDILNAYQNEDTQCDPLLLKNRLGLTAFQCATKDGNSVACRLLFKEGEELSLFEAVKSGDANTVKMFIELGAEFNTLGDGGGISPLGEAIFSDRPDLVEILINAGADVNFPREGHFSPIFIASTRPPELLKILLRHGANPNTYSGYHSPLTSAALGGPSENIIALVEAGGDVTVKGYWKEKLYSPIELLKFRDESLKKYVRKPKLTSAARAALAKHS